MPTSIKYCLSKSMKKSGLKLKKKVCTYIKNDRSKRRSKRIRRSKRRRSKRRSKKILDDYVFKHLNILNKWHHQY